jgi:hypothetical protein
VLRLDGSCHTPSAAGLTHCCLQYLGYYIVTKPHDTSVLPSSECVIVIQHVYCSFDICIMRVSQLHFDE